MKRLVAHSILILYALLPNTTLAHETKENNDTIIFLHINPNDNPIANKPAGLKLLITQKDSSFPSKDCDCKAVVFDKGKEILNTPIFTNGELSYVVPYTFSHAGIFQVKVTGSPKNSVTFKPFTIIFDVRVEGDSVTANFYSQYIQYISGTIFILLILVILYTRKIYKKKYEQKNNS